MLRTASLLAALLATASCDGPPPLGRPPVARLELPECVAVGTLVQLDGSGSYDPDGAITRYVFQIDHAVPLLILAEPWLKYRFDRMIRKGEKYLPYSISLTVQDDDGNRASLEDGPRYLYVLPTEQDCLDNGMEPGGYVYVPPPAGDVAEPPPEDVSEPPPEDMTGPPPEDTGPGDLSLPDPGPPTDTAPGPCPLIAGRYLVQIFNLAVKHLELELHLQQEGCTISEALGIIEGELDADGVLTVRSTFPDLHMEECSGTVEDPLLFEVDCGDGWFATFTQVL